MGIGNYIGIIPWVEFEGGLYNRRVIAKGCYVQKIVK